MHESCSNNVSAKKYQSGMLLLACFWWRTVAFTFICSNYSSLVNLFRSAFRGCVKQWLDFWSGLCYAMLRHASSRTLILFA